MTRPVLPRARANGDLSWRYILRSRRVPKPPWPYRRRPKTQRPWQGLARSEAWPPAPRSPESMDQARLAHALIQICGRLAEDRAENLARWISDYSFRFDVDPFLVGALIQRQSRCRSKLQTKQGVGLTQINVKAHRPLIDVGTYHYYLLEDGEWQPHELDVRRFDFTPRELLKPEASIYFTAAILSVYGKQCVHLDATVRSVSHRHPVSHFYWGDRVLGSRFEDEVLRARRRLLWYYAKMIPQPLTDFRGVLLHSPLDGVPRVISSPFRAPRDHGRRHGGVDFYSTKGEPVRAAADGKVMFAGVSYPKRGSTQVGPSQCRTISRSAMGRGGLFVILTHANGVNTGYFHLSRYVVRQGAQVKGGQIIGYVGRTGIKESDPHLHFEMRLHGRRINPAPKLRAFLVPAWRPKVAAKSSKSRRLAKK